MERGAFIVTRRVETMKQYRLTIPGDPVGKQRPRVFNPTNRQTGQPMMKGGKPLIIAMTPQKTRNFEATIVQMAQAADVGMMERVKLMVIVCIPYRVKVYKTKADAVLEPGRRPDVDNVFKAVADALEGIAFRNDRHVLEIHGYYMFTKERQARTEIIIEEVDWRDYVDWGPDVNGATGNRLHPIPR